jgi:hypothetical protein
MELYIAYEHDREMVTHARVEIGRLKKKNWRYEASCVMLNWTRQQQFLVCAIQSQAQTGFASCNKNMVI